MKDIRQISALVDFSNESLLNLVGEIAFCNWEELKSNYKNFSLDLLTENSKVNGVLFTSEDNKTQQMSTNLTTSQIEELTEILKSADKENFKTVSNIITGDKWENKTKEEIEEKENQKTDKLINPESVSVVVREKNNKKLFNLLTIYIEAQGKKGWLKNSVGRAYTLTVDKGIATVGVLISLGTISNPFPKQKELTLNKIQYEKLVKELNGYKIRDFVIYTDPTTLEFYEEGIKKEEKF